MNTLDEYHSQFGNGLAAEDPTSNIGMIPSNMSDFHEENVAFESSSILEEKSPIEDASSIEAAPPIENASPTEDESPIGKASPTTEVSANWRTQFDPLKSADEGSKIKTEIFSFDDIKSRVEEFEKLDREVKSYGRDSLKAGMALAKIAEQKLWSFQFGSWPAYRAHLISFDVVHICRLVFAAAFVKLVEKANEANPEKVMIVPESEYQIRAISRKLTDDQKLEVWRQACARSQNQPTNQVVNEVRVSLFPTTKESKPPTKKRLIVKALKDVETLLDAEAPFEDIKSSLHHLSRILKVDINEDEESPETAEAY